MMDIEEQFNSYMRRYSHRNKEKEWETFKAYCQEYPHISKKRLLNEYEDKSGDLRLARLSVESGDWP